MAGQVVAELGEGGGGLAHTTEQFLGIHSGGLRYGVERFPLRSPPTTGAVQSGRISPENDK